MYFLHFLPLSLTLLVLTAQAQELQEPDTALEAAHVTPAEDTTIAAPRGAVFVEVLGSSLTYSANFEYIFFRDPDFALAARIGGGMLPEEAFCCPWNYTIGLTSILGSAPHHLELGASYLIIQQDDSYRPRNYLNLLIGYRLQPKRYGILFRASFTPFYKPYELLSRYSLPITPFAGLSLGYSF